MYALAGIGDYDMDDAGMELLKMILSKMHDIEDRQVTNCEAIATIQTTLENGLKKKVDDLCVEMKAICRGYDARLQAVEEFAWFRQGVTRLRDNWFKYSVGLFIVATAIMFGINMGNELFVQAIKALIGVAR